MFIIRRCEETDVTLVDSFLAAVVFDEEPLVAANGPVVVPPADESLSASVIPQGHSILAEDQFGHIIGVCLNDQPPQQHPSIYTNTDDDTKFQELFLYMEERSRVKDLAPGALEVRILAVDPVWRQKGIATNLLETTEQTARLAGFTWLKIYCTSYYSNKLMLKLGWKLLYSLSYEEYINNIECNIRPPTQPHTHCNLYVKEVV
ncbi:arylalkylamine N-acetyltransferase 1-like [Rhodnius prolixus]|uniref:arylalkylamine N-acetyltransferase 1-like n=1 Tax=Rhodnius prolixus TaxID=13249 RepID=UPI003D187EBA